jgi:ribosomal protein L25 (general stress protein Ctc)
VIFVELKTEIGRLRGEQKSQIRKLKRHGQDVRVIYGADEVNQFVQEIRKEVMPE